ncbi:MAG: sigma factor-like helix-turn-helix DNA-binding protein [Patescibacteria group bacterium]|nr:sigma factor-like helix-turn-helix DNA-binding protein [Patescibacteria group bacterium]
MKSITSTKLNRITEELLDNLKDRPRTIIEKRFGLQGDAPIVLEKIGEEFGITRERIRQIESDSFKKLQKSVKSDGFNVVENMALEAIRKAGGFCEKRFLKEKIKEHLTRKQRNQLMFILNSSEKLKFRKGKIDKKGFWHVSEDNKIDSRVVKAHALIVKYIKDKKQPVTFEEILKYVRSDQSKGEFFTGDHASKRLSMILRASRLIDKNILGEWGLKNWKVISQRGAREKAYLVLRKYNKPLHFRKITIFINKHWTEKKALPQTVHNELIKDDRFVLVGRGIYGLCDWGYQEGTICEVIHAFLANCGKPIDKEAIISYVLMKRQVKRTTVAVTLSDRTHFYKTRDGLFSLKQ